MRITPHEARHTFASLMIAAGVNSKVLSTMMGHASVSITLDRYAKLFQAQEREAAGLLDAYLGRSGTVAPECGRSRKASRRSMLLLSQIENGFEVLRLGL